MNDDAIAVIGQACRLPGATDCQQLWSELVAGRDLIREFTDAELRAAGVSDEALGDPSYVKRFGFLEGIEEFDADFFGYTPREAELMDPQHRLLLTCAWAALERAGYRPDKVPGKVGVFAGAAPNRYLAYHLLGNESVLPRDGVEYLDQQLVPGSSHDYLTSRISYKLGLTGPSVAVLTACSSSLAAVALACDNLVEYGCDVALAGGVSISALRPRGYHCQRGGMLSRSGACRPFAASADGSVFGSGVGLVVLRRLSDALADGDHIHCVIRGWALNNDGSSKAGFSAPSVKGQAEAARAALRMAGVDPRSVGLMEAHGSGTPVGDPIEFEALQRAYGTHDRAHCALGSVKANVGHLDAAAGIAGLLAASLALEHRRIPPAIHFDRPNPQIALENSPFYVTPVARDWPRGEVPRRAAVNSTGLGGTNVHLILEEAPEAPAQLAESPLELLLVSGRSAAALERACTDLASHLEAHPEQSLSAVARTLALGRRHFDFRRAVVIAGREGARRALTGQGLGVRVSAKRQLVWMFAGVGDHYAGMALDTYLGCAPFRAGVDRCAALFQAELGFDLRDELYPDGQWRGRSAAPAHDAGDNLDLLRMLRRRDEPVAWPDVSTTHAALFSVEYALASALGEWGLAPSAMIGHSIGELVAACVAGVMSVEDAVQVVALRARLCDGLPEGAMLAVPLSELELVPRLWSGLSLAAVNAPNSCVVSGPPSDIRELERQLKAAGTVAVRLEATRAFHSSQLSEIAPSLEARLRSIELQAPKIPFVSNVTGGWISREQATSPEYWGRQLREPVRFATGLGTLFDAAPSAPSALVELGPGAALSSFAESYLRSERRELPLLEQTVPPSYRSQSSLRRLLETLGKLWASGFDVDWARFHAEARPRVVLPSYPFEPDRFWVPASGDAPRRSAATAASTATACRERIEPAPLAAAARDDAPSNGASNGHAPVERRPAAARVRPALSSEHVSARDEVEGALVAIWCDVLGFSGLGVCDDFFELGGHSFLALQLANEVWRRLRLDLPLHAILANPTIAQLAVLLRGDEPRPRSPATPDMTQLALPEREAWLERYVRAKLALFRSPLREDAAPAGVNEWNTLGNDLIIWIKRDLGLRLYPNELQRFADPRSLARHIARCLEPRRGVARPASTPAPSRVPGVVLLLSSVRAGSTLLRVMLAGHSGLFSPPELHLLPYANLQERARGESSPDRDQGLIRAFAELLGVKHEEASRRVAQLTAENCDTLDVYRRLRAACGQRVLVDKSPGNANQLASLRRAEAYFEQPRYIWLTRHPYSVVDSVVRNRFDSLMEAGHLDPHQFGEFLWQRSNANIADFVDEVEPRRVHRLRYEDLVTDPDQAARQLCQFLDLEFEPSLVKPYDGRRMLDGLGDPNFAERSTIVAQLADEWKRVQLPSGLNRATRELARELGYELPTPGPRAAAISPADVRPPVSLSRGDGGNPLFLVHPLDGNVFCYAHLARLVGGRRPVYGIDAAATDLADAADVSLEQLAAEYLLRAERVQPSGPYFLAGWSMGGIVAFEMARQLVERRKEVGSLVLLDSPAPVGARDEVSDSAYFVSLYARFLSQRLQVDIRLDSKELRRLERSAQLDQLWSAIEAHGVATGLTRAELASRLRVLERNQTSVRLYRPGAYAGAATLVRAAAPSRPDPSSAVDPWTHPDGKYGWSTLIQGPIVALDVAADHFSILEPQHVRALAALWPLPESAGSRELKPSREWIAGDV